VTYTVDGVRHALASALDAGWRWTSGLAACAVVSLVAVWRGMRWRVT
jgi:hypothetical protein